MASSVTSSGLCRAPIAALGLDSGECLKPRKGKIVVARDRWRGKRSLENLGLVYKGCWKLAMNQHDPTGDPLGPLHTMYSIVYITRTATPNSHPTSPRCSCCAARPNEQQASKRQRPGSLRVCSSSHLVKQSIKRTHSTAQPSNKNMRHEKKLNGISIRFTQQRARAHQHIRHEATSTT